MKICENYKISKNRGLLQNEVAGWRCDRAQSLGGLVTNHRVFGVLGELILGKIIKSKQS